MKALAIILCLSTAAGACPTAADVAGYEWFEIDVGCQVPIELAVIYTRRAHEQSVAEIAGLERLVMERDERVRSLRETLSSVRLDAAAEQRRAADKIDELAAALAAAETPPDRLRWFGAGALVTAVAALVVVAALE